MTDKTIIFGVNGTIGGEILRATIAKGKSAGKIIGLSSRPLRNDLVSIRNAFDFLTFDALNPASLTDLDGLFGGTTRVYVCHGVRPSMSAAEFDPQVALDTIKINFLSTAMLLSAFLRNSRQGSHCFVITSIASANPSPEEAAYGPSKAALANFLSVMQQELTARRLFVTEVELGATRSNMTSGRGGIEKLIDPMELASLLISLTPKNVSMRIKSIELLRAIY